MAYRLDSQRIIDVDPPADAAPAHQPPPLPSRGFGFSNPESPSKQVATFHPHGSPNVESPSAAVARSAASPTEFSAKTSVSPTNLFTGEVSPSRASKRVGINPRNEHTDWDFLKNRGLEDSSRLAATEPGVILSTFPRGMAHVPERRPLTEAEVNHFAFLVSHL
jgi:hypothetical protein